MFNEILKKIFIKNNMIDKLRTQILSQFSNITLDGDKYKWCKILSKDTGNSKNKYYYKEIVNLCDSYKEEYLNECLSVDNLKFDQKVSRREISIMSNCGNEQWGILLDDANKKIFMAVNIDEPYKYPDNNGNYHEKRNEFISCLDDEIKLKCFIQAIKGEKNPLENSKNKKVINSNGENENYKIHLFIKKNRNEKLFSYFGEFLTLDIGKEKIDRENFAYYFLLSNKINKHNQEKSQYNTFTKLNIFLDEEIDKLQKKEIITHEEKMAMIKVRINQSSYRKKLIKKYEKCPLSLIEEKNLLIASHIKPYSISTNEEKYNINNGILLSSLLDRLFDNFLITFNEKGKIIYSEKISEKDLLKIRKHVLIDEIELNDEMKFFLNYHNKEFFKRNKK